jgi:hypothetical protein
LFSGFFSSTFLIPAGMIALPDQLQFFVEEISLLPERIYAKKACSSFPR